MNFTFQLLLRFYYRGLNQETERVVLVKKTVTCKRALFLSFIIPRYGRSN